MTAANITNLPTVVHQPDPSEIMGQVLLAGDLSNLSHEERTRYYMQTCQSLGLNPLTTPFAYIRLNGKEVLYANKGCADQLRHTRRVSLEITDRKITGGLMIVTVRATLPCGRTDEDMGAIPVGNLQGEALSNAMLKAVTKAKRRVTLSICGLGMLDESEVRSILESEALTGPVDPSPRPKVKAIEASPVQLPAQEVPKTAPKAKAPLLIRCHDGSDAEFPRTGLGLQEALKLMNDSIEGGHPEVIDLNAKLLDGLVKAYPAMADDVAEMRAAAKMAAELTPDPDAEPDGFVQAFVGDDDDDTFPGDRPNLSDT
jgi:hypothetical protein